MFYKRYNDSFMSLQTVLLRPGSEDEILSYFYLIFVNDFFCKSKWVL